MKTKLVALLILLILVFLVPKVPLSYAQNTLAETLNARINNMDWTLNTGGVLAVEYGNIFGKYDSSAYDSLAQIFLSSSNWVQLIELKRAAEIAGYDSVILDNAVKQALQNIPMVGSLPVTGTGSSGPCFFVGTPAILYGYAYAEKFGVSRWNKQDAFQQLATAVEKIGGGALWFYASNAEDYGSRYYDEEAETLNSFNILKNLGVSQAGAYEDMLWNHLLTGGWWDSRGWFWYRPSWHAWECCMGAFAIIISNYLGSPPSQVVMDLNSKLLKYGWNTGSWSNYVIVHAYAGDQNGGSGGNPQLRPDWTVSAWKALHGVYPYMTSAMQNSMVSMLSQNGWQLTLNSGAFDSWGISGKMFGLIVPFLMGIIPSSASLDTGFYENSYAGSNVMFPEDEYRFDYANRQIRIPVKGPGQLKFLFGSNIATANFPGTGVYTVSFSSDWNSVISVTPVGPAPPPPNKGTLRVFASYQGSYVATPVTITGLESKSGTTTTDSSNPLTFELTAGAYTVSGNYGGTTQIASVTVVAGQTVDVILNFGGSPPPPPPKSMWDQIVEFINQMLKQAHVDSRLLFLGVVAIFGVALWYGNKRLSKRAKKH